MEKPPDSVPEHVGPYEIRAPLGRGGMGEVFRGHDPRLDRVVALKRVQPDSKPDASRRFHREARAAARLSHSSIVKLFDWLEQDGCCWIVMELVEGRSLREMLEYGPLSPGHAARIGLDMAAGLAVAHEAGIVHRDVKPDNVMVTSHGEVKILDFGLAKQIAEHNETMLSAVSSPGAIVGTVSAMSPEQALGKEVDGRSDLFSLGSLLFELLTGEHPFRGASAVDTLTRICTEAPPWPADRDFPETLRALTDRLLEKQPENRPETAQEVVATLEPLAAPRSELSGTRGMMTTRAATGAAGSAAAAVSTLSSTQALSDEALPAGSDPDATGALSEASRESAGITALSAAAPAGPEHGAKRGRRVWIGAIALACGAAIAATAFTRTSRPTGESAGQQADLAGLSAQELYSRGMELLRRPDRSDEHDRAVALFEHLLARDDRSAPAHAGLARAFWLRHVAVYDEQGDPSWLKRAVSTAERAVELDPFLAAARISRGLAYCESGRLDDAAGDFAEVLRLRPDDPQARYGMGCVYEAQNDLEQAVGAYRASLAGDGENPMALHRLGQTLVRAGRYGEAEAVFRQAVERWPDSFMGWRNLGAVRYLQGDVGEAAAMTQKALEIKPDGSLYSNLGTFYFMQGDYIQATDAFERALDMPNMAGRYHAWANLADGYRWTPGKKDKANGAYGRAIELIRRELRSKPENLTLRSRLAGYLAKSGDTGGALEALGSLAIPDDDAGGLYRAAVTYEICGRRPEALDMLAKALGAGYSRKEIESDPELVMLRDDRGYHELLMAAPR